MNDESILDIIVPAYNRDWIDRSVKRRVSFYINKSERTAWDDDTGFALEKEHILENTHRESRDITNTVIIKTLKLAKMTGKMDFATIGKIVSKEVKESIDIQLKECAEPLFDRDFVEDMDYCTVDLYKSHTFEDELINEIMYENAINDTKNVLTEAEREFIGRMLKPRSMLSTSSVTLDMELKMKRDIFFKLKQEYF